MDLGKLGISRRSVAMAAALVGMVSLAIGAHAALNMRALDAAKAIAAEEANALARLKSKPKPDSVVMLFFGGYGVQAGRESYMIPVDATIWKEADVRRDGVSVESVLEAMKEQGACAKLVVLDASRRNPYERRFRTFSHGLAPISVPDNALLLSSATPGQVADDSRGQHSVLVTELLNNLTAQAMAAETVFNNTRVAISRASDGAQVPAVSSSLLEDIRFGANAGS